MVGNYLRNPMFMGRPTVPFENKTKKAHEVYVKNGGTLEFEEFLQLAWAIDKITRRIL